MKLIFDSSSAREGRALAALAVAVAALVGLLGMWGGPSQVEARGPAAAHTGNSNLLLSSSSLITRYVFLPFVFKREAPQYVFFDNFSNTGSGWPHKVTYESCYFEYYGGRYRVKVSDYGQRCIIPNFKIPKQVDGTFSVKVRRVSDEDRKMLYGFIFGAGTDANRDQWSLRVFPNNDPACDNKPFYWLVAIVSGDKKYFRDRCTDAVDTRRDRWNKLTIIRDGNNIKVYINDEPKGEYKDAAYLLNKGYFLLDVTSVSNDTIYVEFDDLEIWDRPVFP